MIDGVFVKDLTTYPDERGFFREIVRFDDLGFVCRQSSQGRRLTGVSNGWHIHRGFNEIFYVSRGTARVVLKDCRSPDGVLIPTDFPYNDMYRVSVDYARNSGPSSTFGEYQEIVIGDYMPRCVLIPAGVAHGYKILSAEADMIYYATETYLITRDDEGRIEPSRWPEHNWTRETETK